MITPHQVQQRFEAILNPFFHSSCALCERPASSVLCSFCLRQLRNESTHQDLSLNAQTPAYWGRYQGVLKRAIARLKYENRPRMGPLLGEELGVAMLQAGHQLSTKRIVSIPLHTQRLQSRQYDQAAVIAKKFAQVTGAHYVAHALVRHRSTPALHNLSPKLRNEALRGAFSLGTLKKCDRKKEILLLDDIYTTGSTMREAERILRQHRFRVAGKIVVAKTEAFSTLLG